MENIRTWLIGEVKAQKYLIDCGYKILSKNCKIGGSEIDIVAILPKNIKINELKSDFKLKRKGGKFSSKAELKFAKKILKNEIRQVKDEIVFVEVKSRTSKKFGNPLETIDKNKQHNIARGCVAYLKKHKKLDCPARIDVISVIDDDIEHIENAFDIATY